MKVLVAMSGGVDSSVAAAELIGQGHQVVGVTMRLWGGESDTGCCSVSDVDDARRVAQQLDIDHLVFNFSDDFDRHVVDKYVQAHVEGLTPNPCIECNRHLKFDRLIQRAKVLGFDAIATGHHAQIASLDDGTLRIARGRDHLKDQSYVVYMLGQEELNYTLFPVGHMTKAEVRERAGHLGLRTAEKPDSQDVCFISKSGGRETFLGKRIEFRRANVVDVQGGHSGQIKNLELVTIGQRRGLGLPGGGPKQFVVDVDITNATVVVGDEAMLMRSQLEVKNLVWANGSAAIGEKLLVQCSAHGAAIGAMIHSFEPLIVIFDTPQRRIAPGQSVVFYDATYEHVLGGGIAQ